MSSDLRGSHINDDLNSAAEAHSAAGFTLLETLIALAILSIASLALMQSTVSMLRSSERAIYIAETSIEKNIERQSLRQLFQEMSMAWDEDPEVRFRGQALHMDAVTSALPSESAYGMRDVRVSIARSGAQLGAQSDPAVTIELTEADTARRIASFEGVSARFSYLGKDRVWYPVWPPQVLPPSGILMDDAGSEIPEWPLAIGFFLEQQDGSRSVWVESLERNETPRFSLTGL